MESGLSLGSNLGNRLENLRQAEIKISRLHGVGIIASSPVYETAPVDVSEKFGSQSFLNSVLIVKVDIPLTIFADALWDIECDMGRKKERERNAPRIIDIDIIYADRICLNESDLAVPHPRWAARRFVVQPLADVRPDLVLPGESQTVSRILLSLPTEPKVILYYE
ncbi:MAG: 2-amino-4-hydroxy-6-hydroxymethyldihydropteridine diphosphokinase [Lentisphaerae bacterium]|nr:2-amino-4-hydroxy-6-hydroxymethyldihydropteridine diphosphokinase [Lentisphaerota bacterium]